MEKNMTMKETKRLYFTQAATQINRILSELEKNPYTYNRSLNDCKEFLWETCSWKDTEVQFGLKRIEFNNLWDNCLMFYDIKPYISYEDAYEFYLHVKIALYGNPFHEDSCSCPVEFVSKLLNIELDKTEQFFYALKMHRITEKQGHGLVF